MSTRPSVKDSFIREERRKTFRENFQEAYQKGLKEKPEYWKKHPWKRFMFLTTIFAIPTVIIVAIIKNFFIN